MQAAPAGQRVSDDTGAATLLGSLPAAEWMIADRGYDTDWFRDALKDKGIKPCIPGRKSRGKAVRHDKRRYRRPNRIEIMFGPLKDWPIVGKTVPGLISDPPHRSPPATADAPRPPSLPSPWPQPSCSGFEDQ